MLINDNIVATVEETDLTQIDTKQAKELLERLIWWYMSGYVRPGDTRAKQFAAGLSSTDTKQMIEENHQDLLAAAGFKNGTISTQAVNSYSNRGKEWIWEKRDRITRRNFRENIGLLGEAKAEAAAIMRDKDVSNGVRLKAVSILVDVTREEGLLLGLHAPTKISVFPDSGKDIMFTADDMTQAALEAEGFERRLLESNNDEVVEGEIVP